MKKFSFAKNVFFHACIPPLLIFAVLAFSLWGNGTGSSFPLTLAIFLTGAGGGVISTYFRLKNIAPTEIEVNAILQVYITPIIAGLLGWICYAFFLTEMLKGPLFPDFTGKSIPYTDLGSVFAIKPLTSLDAAKALLWAFIAGFSEKMIPNILDKLAAQGENSDMSVKSTPTLSQANPAVNEQQKP
jgi:hypothetical protein